MASSPPILPLSNSHPSPIPPISSSSPTPISAPSFRLFLSHLHQSLRRSLSGRRPWPELLDRSAFSRPESLSDATSRLRKNSAYFRTNYLTLISLVLALSLISHPVSLFLLLALISSWCFLYFFRPSDAPLVLFGRAFSDREVLLGLSVVSLFVVFLTSIGSIVISGLLVGGGIVAVHGAFRMPEDLFLDDQEAGGMGAGAGLFSFVGGGNAGVGPAVVAGRV